MPFVKSDGLDIILESLLQRAFIKSKAIDVEALCIYTGKRVWRLKVLRTFIFCTFACRSSAKGGRACA